MYDNPWRFSTLRNSPCKIIETQNLWGQEVCRIWLPHQDAVARERERDHSAFSSRRKSIERVGLPEARRHRTPECDADEKAWRDELAAAQKAVPETRTLLLKRIAGEQEDAGV